VDLFDFRREYTSGGLERHQLDANPFVQFEKWLDQLVSYGSLDPTAMTLASVDAQGQPNQRIVLLKKLDDRGFIFFTNKSSNKADEVNHNPKACLHFPWYQVDRQVKVQGVIEDIAQQESEAYFQRRPRESQLAAWASEQSQPLESREQLITAYRLKEQEYKNEIPMPDFWGGYRLVPHRMEFWQGGEYRLHDRFVYQLESEGSWSIQRLSP
jgi:pyridoxamine 5'-phosphate oxidase